MTTLVDTNVLIDVAACDPQWHTWSRQRLANAWDAGAVVINPIIYSEFCYRYSDIETVDAVLDQDVFRREALPWRAGFAAAQAFRRYRAVGGDRQMVLPDFYIGAHAAVSGHVLLTRDTRRYRTYFPTVDLVTPETHP